MPFCNCEIRFENDPGRRALKYLQLLNLVGYFRHDLYGTGTGTDDTDPLACQTDIVTPARSVKNLTAKRIEPRDIGHTRAT